MVSLRLIGLRVLFERRKGAFLSFNQIASPVKIVLTKVRIYSAGYLQGQNRYWRRVSKSMSYSANDMSISLFQFGANQVYCISINGSVKVVKPYPLKQIQKTTYE